MSGYEARMMGPFIFGIPRELCYKRDFTFRDTLSAGQLDKDEY